MWGQKAPSELDSILLPFFFLFSPLESKDPILLYGALHAPFIEGAQACR